MILSHYEWDPEKDLIAEGGFAEVFKAKDLNASNRWVALKIYKESVSRGTTGSTGQKKYSLEQEFAKIDGLSHTNIITFYGLEYIEHKDAMGRTASYPVIIMEYAGEGTLKELSIKKLSDNDLEEIVVGIIRATGYLHSQGVIHRDLKPGNILFSKDRNGKLVAKITDFGISKDVLDDKTIEQSFTEGVGTPHYMAPEQFFKKKFGLNGEVSERTDIWAIGIILYRLLTGKLPFGHGIKDYELIRDDITQKEVDLSEVPENFKKIIASCLEKEASKRANSAIELLQLIEPNKTNGTARVNKSFSASEDDEVTVFPSTSNTSSNQNQKQPPKKKNKAFKNIIIGLLVVAAGFSGFTIYKTTKIKDLLAEAWKHYKIGEYKNAYASYLQASDYDSGEAYYFLSTMNQNGLGTERSNDKAKEFTKMALDADYKMANFQFGWLYQNGIGVERDTVKAQGFFRKAFDDVVKLSKVGNPEAQNLYGLFYNFGFNIEKDLKKSKEYYLKAAKQQHPAAIENLAHLNRIEKKYKEAFEWYQKCMEINRYSCYREVAKMYRYGYHVEKDTVKALELYKIAAENNDLQSQYLLGNFHYNGILANKDEIKAIAWYTKAAEKGYFNAQNELGGVYYRKENYEGAKKWFLKAADNGNAYARHNMGNLYFYGKLGNRDYKKAYQWYLKSANQGFSWSQDKIGVIYQNGYLGKKDTKKAYEWYLKSANQEYDLGQYHLGMLYYQGVYVQKDIKKAQELFLKSANQNDSYAQYMLGEIAENKSDYKEAKKWYEKSASDKQGNMKAEAALGYLYYYRKGVPKDVEKALKWSLKAAEKNSTKAQSTVGIIYYEKKKFDSAEIYLIKAANKKLEPVETQSNLTSIINAQVYLAFIYEKQRKDYVKAFNYYLKAANNGNNKAQYGVGIYYFSGTGTNVNKSKAKYWLNKSCDNGYNNACTYLKKNY